MSNYKQSAIAGEVWTRFSNISISNPRAGTPSISCTEEQVIAVTDGDEVLRPVGVLNFAFDPGKVFQLIDPTTGEPTGNSMSQGQLYSVLYSCVMAEAAERDERKNNPVPSLADSMMADMRLRRSEHLATIFETMGGDTVLRTMPVDDFIHVDAVEALSAEYTAIVSKYPQLRAKAEHLGISNELMAYSYSFSALTTYMDSLVAWQTPSTSDVPVNGTRMREMFASYFSAAYALAAVINKLELAQSTEESAVPTPTSTP